MSNYHILRIPDDIHVEICFHVPTTAGNNSAGTPWAQCVKDSPEYTNRSCVPSIQRAIGHELIKNGQMIEHFEVFAYSSPTLTQGEKQTEVEARWAALNTAIISELQSKYQWYGYEDDVE